MATIDKQKTLKDKHSKSKMYGLRCRKNPLLKLKLDLYTSTPVECLHTILLGPVKYLLVNLMHRITTAEKSEIEARINSFNFSGFDKRVNGGSICRYHGSLLGRDFKAWAQIGVFIVWDFLSPTEREMWLALAKLFMHSYCLQTCENDIRCVAESCTAFVQAVKAHDPHLLNRPKFHMLLHLPRCIKDFGRTQSFNSERCESFNGLLRLHNIHSNRHASSYDIATKFGHLEHLRYILHGGQSSCKIGAGLIDLASMPEVIKFINSSAGNDSSKSIFKPGALRKDAHKTYQLRDTPLKSHQYATPRAVGGNIHNEYLADGCTVTLYGAVVAAATENYMLCHIGDYILYGGEDEIEIGRLSSCMKHVQDGYCIVQKMNRIVSGNNAVMNDMECPLLDESHRFELIPSAGVLGPVSVIHECGSSCRLITQSQSKIEREAVITDYKQYKHDFTNTLYSINIYSMSYYSILI